MWLKWGTWRAERETWLQGQVDHPWEGSGQLAEEQAFNSAEGSQKGSLIRRRM